MTPLLHRLAISCSTNWDSSPPTGYWNALLLGRYPERIIGMPLNTFINDKINSLQNDDDNEANDKFDVDPYIDCQYYNFDKFLKAKFQPKSTLSIVHLKILEQHLIFLN